MTDAQLLVRAALASVTAFAAGLVAVFTVPARNRVRRWRRGGWING